MSMCQHAVSPAYMRMSEIQCALGLDLFYTNDNISVSLISFIYKVIFPQMNYCSEQPSILFPENASCLKRFMTLLGAIHERLPPTLDILRLVGPRLLAYFRKLIALASITYKAYYVPLG